jgi:hypothetical protein
MERENNDIQTLRTSLIWKEKCEGEERETERERERGREVLQEIAKECG